MYPFLSSETLGFDPTVINWIITAILLFAVFFVLFSLYRLITRPRSATSRRSKNARLAVTDAASIDDNYSLVLVRRDDVEHLLLIGGSSDLVIENNIQVNSRSAHTTATPVPQAPVQKSAPSAPTPPVAPVKQATPKIKKQAELQNKPAPVSKTPVAPSPIAPSHTVQAPAAPRPVTETVVAAAPVIAATATSPAPVAPQASVTTPTLEATTPKTESISVVTAAPKPSLENISLNESIMAAPSTANTNSNTQEQMPHHSIIDDMDMLLNEITEERAVK